jgi:hypothetical protein
VLTRTEQAVELMTAFARRTGLTAGGSPPRRYLWTDAFAVCNLLGLSRTTGDGQYHELALRLVEQVHRTLGRHRADDRRTGWISGASDAEGEAHPTRGGLRIGKPLPERSADEPLDDALEWERDGQYFHYLTKWMHALDQMTRASGLAIFNTWGRELAAAAHRAFLYRPRGGTGQRMYWKTSIDLSRPLVASMGHHDPLDGFITCAQLDTTAAVLPADAGPRVTREIADFAAMIEPASLATADPLGVGGLLVDAYRVAQLRRQGGLPTSERLVDDLLGAALAGLRHYLAGPDLRSSADRRLGFRELGLAIGLAATSLLQGDPELAPSAEAQSRLAQLARLGPVRSRIESFWQEPEHRRTPSWTGHQDINDVMLATSLAPDGFLVLRPVARA